VCNSATPTCLHLPGLPREPPVLCASC
jgi:hypothetical protein